jgi:hypothetical protein
MPSWTWANTNQIQATASVLSLILTLAYVIVTLLGFLWLRRQIKQIDASTRGETYGDLYSHQHQITRYFIDNPNLRPFFYDNKEANSTDSEYGTIRAVTEMVADFCEHVYVQLPNLPSDDIRKGWRLYLKNIYKNSPVLRLHFSQNIDWYGDEFLKIFSQD